MLAPIRPLVSTTYARRGNRASTHSAQESQRSSSPLADLSPSTEDLTVEEMSRRMKKRSRQVTGDSREGSLRGDQTTDNSMNRRPFTKKVKQFSSQELDSLFDSPVNMPDVPSTPFRQSHRALIPLVTQRVNESLFETPFPTNDTLLKSYVIPLADDPISPVPIGHRMLSRTTSRNLKENASRERTLHKSLASPFNSRPTSRSPSPLKTSQSAVKKSLLFKSRTLSSLSLRHDNTSNVDQHPSNTTKDSLFASTYNATASAFQASSDRTSQGVSHCRTASIPNVSSASGLLNDISTESWRVPPKALTRPSYSQEDVQLDVFQADYPSFYFDQPNQVSTPSRRKRQNTVTLKNAHQFIAPRPAPRSYYSDDSDAEMVNTNTQASPCQPRRRRRTIVHMSSDSIFSSALDFSAYSDDSPTRATRPPQASVKTTSLPLGAAVEHSEFAPPVLDTAFSPACGSNGLSQDIGSVMVPTTPPSHRVSRCLSSAAATPAPKSFSSGQHTPARHYGAPSEDELYGMFSNLKLGLDKHASVEQEEDDSGVGIHSFAATSRPIRSQDTSQRRRRGDTIRAADFARPEEVVSPMQFSSRSAHVDILPPNTRRTRSGTVTLAKNAGRLASVGQTGGTVRPKVSRRIGGLPTIKMKIGSPLPQQASDEEDDEMLIKHDTVWRED